MAPHHRIPLPGGSSGLLKARKDGVSMKRSGNAATRPQIVAGALAAQEENGWIGAGIGSGMMHSASRFLTKSAAFLFNSMFKRQAPRITAPSVAAVEEKEEEVPPLEVEQAPSNEAEVLTEKQDIEPTDRNVHNESLQAVDLETILKEKDLTREECERYIELIESKLVDDEAQANISPWRQKGNRATVSFKSQESLPPRDMSLARIPRNEIPVEVRQLTFSSPLTKEARVEERHPETVTRPGSWTPIQRPITGGKELLKRRSTVLDEWTSPARSPLNLRGPTIIRGPSLNGKSRGMDLSCFRKTTNASRTPLKLDVPSIPRQSARTAQTILSNLDRGSPFKDLQRSREPSQVPPEAVLSSKARPSALPAAGISSSFSSGFSFPSSAHGPEPPTPKPIPSPYALQKPRLDEPSNVRNGLLPSYQFKSAVGNGNDLSTYAEGVTTVDMDKVAERVERASSLLAGSRPEATPSLANSPSFSETAVNGVASFETGSSSRRDDQKAANAFESLSGSITGTSTGGLTAPTVKTTTTVQAKENITFNFPAAQSPAPPETNSNGNRVRDKLSKRRKVSVKRLK